MITKNDLQSLIDCLEYEEPKTFLDAIQENMLIRDSKKFWSVYRTPFYKFILQRLEDSNVESIALLCSSQVGKSILLCGIAIEWALRYPGENVYFYCPTNDDAKTLMDTKLIPALLDSPNYRKRLPKCENGEIEKSALSKGLVRFDNGSTIRVLGIAGKTATVSKTSSLVIADEFSKCRSLQKNSGRLFDLLKRRMTSKAYNPHKLIIASTPLNANEDIDEVYQESKQFSWSFGCPHCGSVIDLDFSNLKKSPKPEDMNNVIYADKVAAGQFDVWYECPDCNGRIEEKDKAELLYNGFETCIGNEHLSDKQIAIRLQGLYSSEKWASYMRDWIRAQDSVQSLMEFKAQVLVQPWEKPKTKCLVKSDFGKHNEAKKNFPPSDTYKLVAGIDVQGNRFYYVVLAVTSSKKIVLIDWGISDFKLDDHRNPDSLPYKLQNRTYGNYPISKIIMDGGFNQTLMQDIANDIPNIELIKGTQRAKYANQLLYRLNSNQLLFCPKVETNELFESLVLSDQFQLPLDLNINEEILEHYINVQRKLTGSKVDYVDKDPRIDYRDSTRYALAWIYYKKLLEEVDREEYRKVNQEEIKKKAQAMSKNIANAFGRRR